MIVFQQNTSSVNSEIQKTRQPPDRHTHQRYFGGKTADGKANKHPQKKEE